MATANIKAVITAEDRASATLGAFGDNVGALGSKITGALKVASVAAFAAIATGVIAATKASWDQVDAVQQATVALNAYERDSSKVNSVLKDLVSYARSDLGVLFNRKDLFQSAQSLKIYGDNTESLTDHVKILSRSVGLGLSTWEGLNNVIGRVGSTGKLYADDLQYLQNAGFKLDGSLSGTTQTFESLFALLDKGIPADALAGQATTIQGKMVRLETAFRGVGDAILGVDKETGKFAKGGIGDTIVLAIDGITKALNTPEFKQAIKDSVKAITEGFKQFMDIVRQIVIVLQPLTEWIKSNDSAMQGLQKALIGIGITIATIIIVIGIIVYAFVLLGTAILDVQNKIDYFKTQMWASMALVVGAVSSSVNQAVGWFSGLPGRILGAIGQLGHLLFGAGQDIVFGLVNGIKSAAGSAAEAVRGVADNAVKAAKNALGIRSPSTVFAGIGKNVGLGMVQGIESTIPSIAGTMNNLVPSINPTSLSQGGQPSTVVNQKNPTPNITIQVGAFMGTQTDARKLAKMVFDSYKDLQAMGNT